MFVGVLVFATTPLVKGKSGLSFPPEGIVFGEIPVGTNAVRVMRIRNTGDCPIVVSRVKACCGATARLVPDVIISDGEALLTVDLTPTEVGSFSRKIQLSSNDPTAPLMSVPVTGIAVTRGGPTVARSAPMSAFVAIFMSAYALMGLFMLGRGLQCRKEGVGGLFSQVSGFLLGAVFVYAGVMKVTDAAAFADLITRYDILPSRLSPLIAFLLPRVEILIGWTLNVPRFVRVSAGVSAALLIAFMVALAQAVIRGLDVSCGCFGSFAPNSSAELGLAFGRDVVLLTLSVFVLTVQRESRYRQ